MTTIYHGFTSRKADSRKAAKRERIQRAVLAAIKTVEAQPAKRSRPAKRAEPVQEPTYTKEATPEQAAEIYQAIAEICKVTGMGEVEGITTPKPVELPTWKPAESDGFPSAGDTFHIVTLKDGTYNGYRLPFPSGIKFPVFMVANQNGALMRTPRDDGKKAGEMTINWYYRTSDYNDPDTPVKLAIGDLKRLKTWQRYHFSNHTESLTEINLPATGNVSGFEIKAREFAKLLKDYGEKVYLDLAGYLFPAKIIREVCRLASADLMHVAIENAEKPTIVMKHGNSKTRLFGMTKDVIPAGIDIIPCAI